MSHPTPDPSGPASAKDARARAASERAYRKASRPWFKKKRTWILGAVLLLILASCMAGLAGGGGDTSTGAEQTQPETQTQPEQTQPEAAFPGAQDDDVIGSAGDTLDIGDVSVTAGALTPGDNTLGETLCTPVSVVNNAEDTVDFNLLDWELQAPSGTILNAGFTGADDILAGGKIAPGGTTSGTMCFDAEATEAGQYVVFYEPTFSFSGDRGAWLNQL